MDYTELNIFCIKVGANVRRLESQITQVPLFVRKKDVFNYYLKSYSQIADSFRSETIISIFNNLHLKPIITVLRCYERNDAAGAAQTSYI